MRGPGITTNGLAAIRSALVALSPAALPRVSDDAPGAASDNAALAASAFRDAAREILSNDHEAAEPSALCVQALAIDCNKGT